MNQELNYPDAADEMPDDLLLEEAADEDEHEPSLSRQKALDDALSATSEDTTSMHELLDSDAALEIRTVIPKAVGLEHLSASIQWLVDTRKWDLPFNRDTKERKVFGFNLPAFQRDNNRWSIDQKTEYIDTLWRGWPCGSIMWSTIMVSRDQKRTHPHSGLLIDGQQRMTAIYEYMTDCFPMYGLYFSQLSLSDKQSFLDTRLELYGLPPKVFSYQTMAIIYDRYNYGGTVHDETERAVKDRSALRTVKVVDGKLIVVDSEGHQHEALLPPVDEALATEFGDFEMGGMVPTVQHDEDDEDAAMEVHIGGSSAVVVQAEPKKEHGHDLPDIDLPDL